MRSLRIGIVGKRGTAHAAGFRAHPHAEVTALCDADPAVLAREANALGIEKRFAEFEPMLKHIDAVFVATPMPLHAQQSLAALAAGKHVLSEVTACVSLDECYALTAAVRSSGLTYMMAENYLYFEESLIVQEMARNGLFGKPYFGEGEYVHDVKPYHHFPDGRPTWRTRWQVGEKGNTYPTHSLGPPLSWFEAAGDDARPVSVVCWGSGVHTDPEHPHDDTTETLVRLSGGGLVRLRLDMMSNRPPEEAFYGFQGTQGVFESGRGRRGGGQVWVGENPPPGPVKDEHRAWRPVGDFADLVPPSVRALQDVAKGAGHGGGDFMVAYAFVQAVLGEAANPVDVFKAVEWTAVGLCSIASINTGGVTVALPNFRD
jgi:predicted dehydrogenase